MMLALVAAIALQATAAPAQTDATPAPAPVPTPTAEPIDPTLPRVDIETSMGKIIVAIETKRAPITGANFLKYVDQHRLDGVNFYRIVKVQDHYGFVQFGENGDPKRSLPPIKHESTDQTGIHHLDGTLSMPRREVGTAAGEFTITVGDQTLGFDAGHGQPADGLGYAAFGHVVEGMDVVVKIMDGAVSPDATLRGAFKGEVPATPVKILSARRIAG